MDLAQSSAHEVIEKYLTNDPFVIAKRKGINIIHEDLGSIYGYFHKSNRITSIHINNRLSEWWQIITCSHELGHFILHPGINMPFLRSRTLFSTSRFEYEANRFTVYLLIGDNRPYYGESKGNFLFRCGIPEDFHPLYT